MFSSVVTFQIPVSEFMEWVKLEYSLEQSLEELVNFGNQKRFLNSIYHVPKSLKKHSTSYFLINSGDEELRVLDNEFYQFILEDYFNIRFDYCYYFGVPFCRQIKDSSEFEIVVPMYFTSDDDIEKFEDTPEFKKIEEANKKFFESQKLNLFASKHLY